MKYVRIVSSADVAREVARMMVTEGRPFEFGLAQPSHAYGAVFTVSEDQRLALIDAIAVAERKTT